MTSMEKSIIIHWYIKAGVEGIAVVVTAFFFTQSNIIRRASPYVPTLKLSNNVEPQEAFAAIEPSDDLIPQDDFEQFLEFIHHT